MECIFLNAAGTVLFTRADMESGHWVQQEMSVTADFPYLPEKVIERGQRIAFRDPATNVIEMFEIRNVQNVEPEHYQQISAEHVCISELQDEHINSAEITNKTAKQALTQVLSGTGWTVGRDTSSGKSSGDVGRGSVWNAVTMIRDNWNVYITPRIAISAAGAVTRKYLDIAPAQGVWRGVRLSVSKNQYDSSVTYDDEEVLTALYGYGGNIDVPQSGGAEDKQEELTFSGVTWTKTADHPAKPAGQTYLEWPEKTAIYGRAGRARFGYYQNSQITDAATLLQKTWEALKRTAEPKINIVGTVADLYRLGYTDEPLRLHDLAIVEIAETGERFYKEIITLDVDLVDPTGNRPEIGDYIPNIIYINRDTNAAATGTEDASGSGGSSSSGAGNSGGGGGSRGETNSVYHDGKHYTEWVRTADKIGMVVGTWNGGYKIKAGEITLAINDEDESIANINATHVNISATDSFYSLAGDMEHDADGRLVLKSAGGIYVQKTDAGVTSYYGVWDQGNLTGGVVVDLVNGQTTTYISGDKINIASGGTVQTLAGTMVADAAGNLTILNGSGFRLSRAGAEYGVWDEGNLTGGVIVTKINGQTETKITGDSINIGSVINIINSGSQTSAKISADQVDINGSSVVINAAHVDINGILSSSQFETRIAQIDDLVGDLMVHGALTCGGNFNAGSVSTDGAVSADGNVEAGSFVVAGLGVNVGGTATEVHTISIDNEKVADFLGTADVNFDRAAARKEGADAVTLSSAGWQSGGRNIVTASNGKTLTVNLPTFTANQTEWNASHKKTVNFSTASVSVPLSSVTVDASGLYTDAYNAGVADGKAAAGVAVNTANKSVYVTTSTTKSVVVSATAEISYNSNTHKYTAIGRAKAGGRAMDYASAVSGTEAYQAGIDSVDTQTYYNNGYNAGFTSGWQSYYNASGWNKNSDGQVLIPAASGSGSEVWFNLADELPGISFTWWNPAKGVAGVYFYIWGKYYGTSHEIPPGWM